MNIGEILTKSWQIIWKHKILWIFGILASCASGNGGGSGGGSGGGGNAPDNVIPWENFGNADQQLARFIEQNGWVLAIIVTLICVLALVFFVIGIVGRIALIKGALRVDSGAEHLAFGELWNASLPSFWRVLFLNLAIGLVFGLVALVLFFPLFVFSAITFGIGLIIVIPLLCLFGLVAWVAGLVIKQAEIAVVAEDASFAAALTRGWSIVSANFWNVILMAIILGVIGFIVGLFFIIPAFLVAAPFLAGFAIDGASSTIALAIGGLCLAIFLPFLILGNGIVTAYIESAWTLTFARLTGYHQSADSPLKEVIEPA